MKNLLELKGLTKTYRGFKLDHLDLTLPGGAIMGLVGENGAGKTTTIKLILNEIQKDSGSVSIFGLDNIREEQRIKEQIGVVFDGCNFHPQFTFPEIGRVLKGVYKTWNSTLYQDTCRRFGLSQSQRIKDYSKGMKMKLSIAAALSHRPKLLILDEATSGLDPIVRDEILDIFMEFIQDEEHSILFSSHITSDLERVADYITFLHKGQLVLSQSKESLLEHYGILKCGASEFDKIDRADVVAWRKNSFQVEALTSNRQRAAAKYRNMVIDKATIDDIMLFTIKGDHR